ncbi:hypothetical protein [Aliidongia dinghuensis]|nr:hypothetical protein [Aliidongia dinghuensis]
MSAHLFRLRRALPAVLFAVAVASGVAACADFQPDNSPHSPNFHSFTVP